jgi:peptidoglycan/LPS O-acetylase OafA/YrhL
MLSLADEYKEATGPIDPRTRRGNQLSRRGAIGTCVGSFAAFVVACIGASEENFWNLGSGAGALAYLLALIAALACITREYGNWRKPPADGAANTADDAKVGPNR